MRRLPLETKSNVPQWVFTAMLDGWRAQTLKAPFGWCVPGRRASFVRQHQFVSIECRGPPLLTRPFRASVCRFRRRLPHGRPERGRKGPQFPFALSCPSTACPSMVSLRVVSKELGPNGWFGGADLFRSRVDDSEAPPPGLRTSDKLHNQALIALERRCCDVPYAMIRDGIPYPEGPGLEA